MNVLKVNFIKIIPKFNMNYFGNPFAFEIHHLEDIDIIHFSSLELGTKNSFRSHHSLTELKGAIRLDSDIW